MSLCPQGVSQPDLGVVWHCHGVVKAGGSEQEVLADTLADTLARLTSLLS